MMFFEHNKYRTRIEFRVFGKNFVWYMGNAPSLITFGDVNECTDDYWFVSHMDFDNIHYSKVVKSLNLVLRMFFLHSFVVIVNSEEEDANGDLYGNYGVIGLDKIAWFEHKEILKYVPCDRNYPKSPFFYKDKNWIIRFFEKWYSYNGKIHKDRPHFKEIITNPNPRIPEPLLGHILGPVVKTKKGFERECSYGHYLQMKQLFGIPKLKLPWDGITKTEFISYQTGIK